MVKPFELIIYLRLAKMLSMLYEIRSMRLILQTIVYMMDPISSLLVVTILIFYVFAVWGMYLFGGFMNETSIVN